MTARSGDNTSPLIAIVDRNILKVGLSGQDENMHIKLVGRSRGVVVKLLIIAYAQFMEKRAIMTALLLSACSSDRSDNLYTGFLQPLLGACDPPAQAQLVIRGDTVVFVPNSGTLVLPGTKSGDNITAFYAMTGAEGRKYTLKFEGAFHGSRINGIYQNARCRYAVSLQHTSS